MPISEVPPQIDRAGDALPFVRVRPPGPASAAWAARLERSESPALWARRKTRAESAGTEMAPIVYASAFGSNVVDVDGNRYVDLAAGFGSVLLGHGSALVARALEAQSARLWMALGDLYPSDVKVLLTEKLAELYPAKGARVLLGQSGSDAVAAAIKTSKLATGKPGVVAFEGSYHGLGYGPLATSGLKASWRAAFADQDNAHVVFAPYPRAPADVDRSLSTVKAALERGDIGCVLLEPILGRGGCIVPAPSFLTELHSMTRRARALLVADEVWTGLGRSGHWVASVAMGVLPDLICFGKGLGGGLPISACVGPDEIMQSWRREPPDEVVSTATFNGAPLACATAIATIDALRSGELDLRAREVGDRFRQRLESSLRSGSRLTEVRGQGLMVGIAFGGGQSALGLHRQLLEAGYIVSLGGMSSEVIVVTPALTVSEGQLDAFAFALSSLLGEGASA